MCAASFGRRNLGLFAPRVNDFFCAMRQMAFPPDSTREKRRATLARMSRPGDPLGFENTAIDEMRRHLDELAGRSELRGDASLVRVRELLESTSSALRTRGETEHRVNNALAGVLASLDFAQFAFADADPSGPLFPHASVSERQNALDALRHALDAAKKLAAALRGTEV